MSTLAQRSFSGGEISQALYARCDTVKYATGLRTQRNMFTRRSGGASNRAATSFIGEVKDSTKRVRLIKFVFNNAQTYMLEFGNLYMRVIKAGVYQTLTAQNITGMTTASPAVFTYTGSDTLANGDEVALSGFAGNLGQYLNGRNFKIANVNTGANTFQLVLMDGSTSFNSTGLPAYTSGGQFEEIYEITTPYVEADLQELKYDQSGDVISITHPSYPPAELTRTGDTSWTLDTDILDPQLSNYQAYTTSANPWSSSTKYISRYAVTAVDENGQESLPSFDGNANKLISGITKANPAVVTHAAFSDAYWAFQTGDKVKFPGISGMTELEDGEYTITVLSGTTFQLDGVDSTGFGTFTSGFVKRAWTQVISSAALSSSNYNVIQWAPASFVGTNGKVIGYNIYRERNGVFGFLDFVGEGMFVSGGFIGYTDDDSLEPDYSDTPPEANTRFLDPGDYPSVVAYMQQRRVLAAPDSEPNLVTMSRIGAFGNYTKHRPLQADDAISFNVVGRLVERIRHIIELGAMVIFTGSSEHAAEGQSGAFIAGEINIKQQSFNGCSDLRPLVLNDTALYVQERGTIVRDLNFDFQVDGYRGNDLTTFSNHLFDGYEIVDWDHQKVPDSIVWAARDDGQLLGLTYVREQQIFAWHHHDFENGLVENVCVIPEGDYDAVYMVIKRVINGRTVRYVERMDARYFQDILDANFCDSGLAYDGRHTGSTTMTISGGTGDWDAGQTLTLTASASTFASGDVGKSINMRVPTYNGHTYVRALITAYTSATVVSVEADIAIPTTMRSVAIDDWATAIDTIDGLWHLEGEDVSVLGDAFVLSSPYNPDQPTLTVTNGRITLDANYGVVRVGLPITADLETLNIDTPAGETTADKSENISAITAWFEKTRGVFIGPKNPSEVEDWSGDVLENLVEMKVREYEAMNEPTRLLTDTKNIDLLSEWNSNGRVFIRQVDPLPMTINAIAPAGLMPFTGGG